MLSLTADAAIVKLSFAELVQIGETSHRASGAAAHAGGAKREMERAAELTKLRELQKVLTKRIADIEGQDDGFIDFPRKVRNSIQPLRQQPEQNLIHQGWDDLAATSLVGHDG